MILKQQQLLELSWIVLTWLVASDLFFVNVKFADKKSSSNKVAFNELWTYFFSFFFWCLILCCNGETFHYGDIKMRQNRVLFDFPIIVRQHSVFIHTHTAFFVMFLVTRRRYDAKISDLYHFNYTVYPFKFLLES